MTTTAPALSFILASASPARLKTLHAAGVRPRVLVSGVDESTVDDSDPDLLSATLARLKAEAVVTRLKAEALAQAASSPAASGPTATDLAVTNPGPPGTAPRTLVLGCDSVLAFGGAVLGKPSDPADAARRWREMRGGTGVLHTGHYLVEADTGEAAHSVARTTVHFADLSAAEINAYVATGEPLHVAGAFTIDGLGGWFVERIEGDHGTVVGISLPLLRKLLAVFGLTVADLWAIPAA